MDQLNSDFITEHHSPISSENEDRKIVNIESLRGYKTKPFYFNEISLRTKEKGSPTSVKGSRSSFTATSKMNFSKSFQSKSKSRSKSVYTSKENDEADGRPLAKTNKKVTICDRNIEYNNKYEQVPIFQLPSSLNVKSYEDSPAGNYKSEKSERFRKMPNSLHTPLSKKSQKKHSPYLNLLNSIGKMLKMANRAKKNVFYKTFSNLSPQQFMIIDDWSYIQNTQEKIKSRISLLNINSYLRIISKLINNFISALVISYAFIKRTVKPVFKRIPIINPNSYLTFIFNLILCFLILYTNFTITLEIFFDSLWYKETFFFRNTHPQITFVAMLFFFTQIIFNFNTGFYKHGQVIMNRTSIILRYLKSTFILDVLSTLPLIICPNMISHSISSICVDWGLLKLLVFLKLINMQKIFSNFEETLSLNEKLEGILCFFKLIFKLGFMAHMLACLWNSAAYYNQEKNWLIKSGLDIKDWPVRYLFSLYWSVTTIITVGYGDISPQNFAEVGLSILAMIFGCGIFGYSINSVGAILKKFENKENLLRENLKILNRYMKRKNLDYELQTRVRRSLAYMIDQEEAEQFIMEQKILDKLPFSLKDEVLLQTNGKILADKQFINYFSDDVFKKIVRIMKRRRFTPEETIFNEGDADDSHLFFVADGVIDLFVNAEKEKGNPLVLKKCTTGDTFGEMEFFTGLARKISARSSKFSSVFSIDRKELYSILKEHPRDLEIFCIIRDKILLYGDQGFLQIACLACGQDDHEIVKCPSVKLSISKEIYLRKMLYTEDQKRNMKGRRFKKSKNALFEHSNLVDVANNLSKTMIKEHLKEIMHEADEDYDEDDENSSYGQESNPASHMTEEQGNDNELSNLAKAFSISKSRKSIASRKSLSKPQEILAIVEENFNNSYEKTDTSQSIVSNSYGLNINQVLQRKSIVIPPENRRESVYYERNSTIDPLSLFGKNSLEKSESRKEEKKTSNEVVEKFIPHLQIDSVCNFEMYFPYNNCTMIAKYFNKKVKQRRKNKLKSTVRLVSNNSNKDVPKSTQFKCLIEYDQQKKFFVTDLVAKRNKSAFMGTRNKPSIFVHPKLSVMNPDVNRNSVSNKTFSFRNSQK